MIFTLKLVICNVAFAVSLPSLQLILISPIHEILKEAEPLELKEPVTVLSSYEIIICLPYKLSSSVVKHKVT